MHLKIPSAKWWPFCPGKDELKTGHHDSCSDRHQGDMPYWRKFFIFMCLVVATPYPSSIKGEGINPLPAEVIWGNIKVHLYFYHSSTLKIFRLLWLTHKKDNKIQIQQSISWLLMPWRREEPGHQQPWCWLLFLEYSSLSTIMVNIDGVQMYPNMQQSNWCDKSLSQGNMINDFHHSYKHTILNWFQQVKTCCEVLVVNHI